MEVEAHPRPRTAEEIAALPIGPAFGMRVEIINGIEVRIPMLDGNPVLFWSEDTDVVSYSGPDGRWNLGRYADGRWFRQRMEA